MTIDDINELAEGAILLTGFDDCRLRMYNLSKPTRVTKRVQIKGGSWVVFGLAK